MPGTFTQTPYCKKSTHDLNIRLAPGSYDIQVGGFSGSAVDERAAGPGWKRAFEVARLAKMPHLLHKEQWELKRILVINLLFIQAISLYFMEREGQTERKTERNEREGGIQI